MERLLSSKNEKQSIYEIFRACRLCGAGGGYKMPIVQNIPIDVDETDVELRQKIRECVQIEVNQADRMPPLICELCVDKVNDFYEFLDMCRQTNKRTRLRLGLPPQALPRGAPDAGDCILGVTEQVYKNEDSNDVPLAKKIMKSQKPKKPAPPPPPPAPKVKKAPTPEPEVVVVTRRTAKTEIPRPSKTSKQVKVPTRALRDAKVRSPSPPPTRRMTRQSPSPPPTRRMTRQSPSPPPTRRMTRQSPSPPPTRRMTRQTNEEDKEESVNLSKLKLQAKNKDKLPKTSPTISKTSSTLSKTSPTISKTSPKGMLRNSIKTPETPLLKPRDGGKRPKERDRQPRVPMKKVKIAIKPVVPVKPERRRAPTPPPPPPPPPARRSAPQPAPEPEERHTCRICSIVCSKSIYLTNHMKTHTVQYTPMKQACNSCRDWFPTADKASAHHRWHRTTCTPYHCDACTADFKHHSAYNEHFEYNTCIPSTEVPDLKCPECWGLFPTRTLMDQHRCPGEDARPGGKCNICRKTLATARTLRKHEEACRAKRKSDIKVRYSDEVRERMRPVYVRFARCDPLLDSWRRMGDGHYDVYGLEQDDYGLDNRYVYPYWSELCRVRIKSEPETYNYDDMVHIKDEIKDELFDLEEAFVHWDSDDSQTSDDVAMLETPFDRKHKPMKVDSLSRLSIKTIFSNSFLGKVPKRKRRLKREVKAELGFDMLLNIENVQSVSTSNLDRSHDSVNTSNMDLEMTDNTERKGVLGNESNGAGEKSEDVSLKDMYDTETKSQVEESYDSDSMIKDYSMETEDNITDRSTSECVIENAENETKSIDDKVSDGSSYEPAAIGDQISEDAKQDGKDLSEFDTNFTEPQPNGTVDKKLDTTPNNDMEINENKESIESDKISSNETDIGVKLDDTPQENVSNINQNEHSNETNVYEKSDDFISDVRRDDEKRKNNSNENDSFVNDDRHNESIMNREEIIEDSNKLEDKIVSDLDEGGANREKPQICSDDIQSSVTDKSATDELYPIEGKNSDESVSGDVPNSFTDKSATDDLYPIVDEHEKERVSDDIQDSFSDKFSNEELYPSEGKNNDDVQNSFTDKLASDKLDAFEGENCEESVKISSENNLLNGDTKDYDKLSDKDFGDLSDTELDDKKLLEALDEQIDDIGRRESVEENVPKDNIVNNHDKIEDSDIREDSNTAPIKEDLLHIDDKIEDAMEYVKIDKEKTTQDSKKSEEMDKSEYVRNEDTAQTDNSDNQDLDKLSNNDITEEREKFLLEDRPMEEFSEMKDKITMDDIIGKNIDSMDLDNISDDEFDFDA